MKSQSANPKPGTPPPHPDLYRRAIAVFRINRTFALTDCPKEPVEVLRVGAKEGMEVLMVCGAPASVEDYLNRVRSEAEYEERFKTVIEI
jgi:hypothetical protein